MRHGLPDLQRLRFRSVRWPSRLGRKHTGPTLHRLPPLPVDRPARVVGVRSRSWPMQPVRSERGAVLSGCGIWNNLKRAGTFWNLGAEWPFCSVSFCSVLRFETLECLRNRHFSIPEQTGTLEHCTAFQNVRNEICRPPDGFPERTGRGATARSHPDRVLTTANGARHGYVVG